MATGDLPDASATAPAAAGVATGDLIDVGALVAPAAATGGRGPVIIIGPSGVGKGTLVQRLLAEHGDKFSFTVRATVS